MNDTMPESTIQTPAEAPSRSSAPGCGCLSLAGGIVLVLVGIPMLVCPGPGAVTILAGFGMIGGALGLKRREEAAAAHEDTGDSHPTT